MEFYGTLGPSCAGADTLAAMFRLGMTGVRLNLSHTTLRAAAEQIDALHAAAAGCGVTAKLLIDMQGPELRVGALAAPVSLAEGRPVRLGRGGIPVPEPALEVLRPGQQVLLDDGKLLLRTERVLDGAAEALVLRGGVLQSRKSIALPGANVHPPPP